MLDPLNHLIALALELPPDFFTKVHRWEEHDESHLRYMKYSKFSPQEIEQLSDGLWSRGHTDLGTITLLFRQPVVSVMNLRYSLVLHSLYLAISFPGPMFWLGNTLPVYYIQLEHFARISVTAKKE